VSTDATLLSKKRITSLTDQPKAKSGTGKEPAAAAFGASKTTKAKRNPLFEANVKKFGIGVFSLSLL